MVRSSDVVLHFRCRIFEFLTNAAVLGVTKIFDLHVPKLAGICWRGARVSSLDHDPDEWNPEVLEVWIEELVEVGEESFLAEFFIELIRNTGGSDGEDRNVVKVLVGEVGVEAAMKNLG